MLRRGARLAFYTGTFQGREPGGIFAVPANDGLVEVLVSNEVATTRAVWYLPEAGSPDGHHILVTAVSRQTEGCFVKVLVVGRRLLLDLPTSNGRPRACGAAWLPGGELLVSVPPAGTVAA